MEAKIAAMRSLALALAMIGLAGCAPMRHESPANADFGRALAPIGQADMPEALARLAALRDEALSASQKQARDCIVARFAPQAGLPEDSDLPPPVAAALRAYRRYWTAVLARRAPADKALAELSAELGALTGMAGGGIDARAKATVRLIERHGLHALGGVTPPLHELMLWRSQARQRETVALPGGSFDVTVFLLDGFASLGWAGWASCERSHTGGWTTSEGIMVVAPAWDRASEDYRVSLLAHEAQHFRDKRLYPKLAATDLEYRAKLVELALADETQGALLERFSAEAKRERALPHPFASYWVVRRLKERLGAQGWVGLSRRTVREAAAAELAAHGAALDARGAATVESALRD